MTRERWLVVAAGAGVLLFALSFVNGWIAHDRELRGEGYRFVQITLNAWHAAARPVLAAGAVAALATAAVAALVLARRWRLGTALLLPGAVLTLSLVAASAIPISQDGHASSLDLGPTWLMWIGIVLALIMVAAAAAVARPTRRVLTAATAATFAIALVGAGGRWLQLQASQGSGAHWSDGTYTLAAGEGDALTLMIANGRYTLADRWSGSWESSGWTVVLVDDPACPEDRGTYHAHGEGPEGVDLRFVKVVDTCEGGARAELLESGIWER